jgi:hypothetical protein
VTIAKPLRRNGEPEANGEALLCGEDHLARVAGHVWLLVIS